MPFVPLPVNAVPFASFENVIVPSVPMITRPTVKTPLSFTICGKVTAAVGLNQRGSPVKVMVVVLLVPSSATLEEKTTIEPTRTYEKEADREEEQPVKLPVKVP